MMDKLNKYMDEREDEDGDAINSFNDAVKLIHSEMKDMFRDAVTDTLGPDRGDVVPAASGTRNRDAADGAPIGDDGQHLGSDKLGDNYNHRDDDLDTADKRTQDEVAGELGSKACSCLMISGPAGSRAQTFSEP